MIDKPNHEKMALIQQFNQIKADLQAMIDNGRSPCPVLAGDLMEVAEKLHCDEAAQDFIRELQEQQQVKPTGPFRGIDGGYT